VKAMLVKSMSKLLSTFLFTSWILPLCLHWSTAGCMMQIVEAAADSDSSGDEAASFTANIIQTQQGSDDTNLTISDNEEGTMSITATSEDRPIDLISNENDFVEKYRPILANFLVQGEECLRDLTVQLKEVKTFKQAKKISQEICEQLLKEEQESTEEGKQNVKCERLKRKIIKFIFLLSREGSNLQNMTISFFEQIMSDFSDVKGLWVYIEECYVIDSSLTSKLNVFDRQSEGYSKILEALEIARSLNLMRVNIIDGKNLTSELLTKFFSTMRDYVTCLNSKISNIQNDHFARYVRDGHVNDRTESLEDRLNYELSRSHYRGSLKVEKTTKDTLPKRTELRPTKEGVKGFWNPESKEKKSYSSYKSAVQSKKLNPELIKRIEKKSNITNSMSTRPGVDTRVKQRQRCSEINFDSRNSNQQPPMVMSQ
ncbi:hypothetical protein THOM_0354, partial [Trachipleistophora hominis]